MFTFLETKCEGTWLRREMSWLWQNFITPPSSKKHVWSSCQKGLGGDHVPNSPKIPARELTAICSGRTSGLTTSFESARRNEGHRARFSPGPLRELKTTSLSLRNHTGDECSHFWKRNAKEHGCAEKCLGCGRFSSRPHQVKNIRPKRHE